MSFLRLGLAGMWCRPSMQVSLCLAGHRPVAEFSSDSHQSSPSVPTDLCTGDGVSLDTGNSTLLKLPSRGTGPFLLPLLFLFSSSFFHPTQSHRELSCPFRCLRSSASVQLVLCENCSIHRCILDEFVGREELHVLLLLHHLDYSRSLFFIIFSGSVIH